MCVLFNTKTTTTFYESGCHAYQHANYYTYSNTTITLQVTTIFTRTRSHRRPATATYTLIYVFRLQQK